MLRWRAVYHETGIMIATGPACEPLSWALASSLVDLRWQFMGQGATVTLECVDESDAVVARWAPHPVVEPLPPERIGELLGRFGV
jgi:hypothetical protein